MRQLLQCPACRRQLEAGDRAAGEVVLCLCGTAVAVPRVAAHDSAVVRCSACGAPRAGVEAACRFCGSSFTVHEIDIDTICPHCMARVAGSSRFCDHCGEPILVAQAQAAGKPLPCPACGGGRPLASRRLGEEAVAVAACGACGGLWVDSAVFEILAARARHAQLGSLGNAQAAAPSARASAAAPHRLYQPCATCGKLMNRVNFGRKSGVIGEVCRGHGLWFEAEGLARVLAWISTGGEEGARRVAAEEAQATARAKRLATEGQEPAAWGVARPETGVDLLDLLGDSLRSLFRPLL